MTPPCLATLEEWLMLKTSLRYFTGCIAKSEVMWATKKLLQRYSGIICFMNIIQYNRVWFLLLQISACYECLPRSAVQKFVSLCPLCSTQKVQHNQAPLKPIIASGFMSRGQVSYTLCTAKQS